MLEKNVTWSHIENLLYGIISAGTENLFFWLGGENIRKMVAVIPELTL